MRQLLQNLLSNALKFHPPGKPPIVHISALRSPDGNWSLIVQDHGVGFDEAYADRMFRPFQRLHQRSEFEGSGIGLAICRKIVDRHGGTIRARSRPGEGAVFTVTLPGETIKEIDDASVEAHHDLDCRGR
jgi:signal transduction histidine kinase